MSQSVPAPAYHCCHLSPGYTQWSLVLSLSHIFSKKQKEGSLACKSSIIFLLKIFKFSFPIIIKAKPVNLSCKTLKDLYSAALFLPVFPPPPQHTSSGIVLDGPWLFLGEAHHVSHSLHLGLFSYHFSHYSKYLLTLQTSVSSKKLSFTISHSFPTSPYILLGSRMCSFHILLGKPMQL